MPFPRPAPGQRVTGGIISSSRLIGGVQDALTVSGDTAVGGTLDVTGATTLDTTLAVTGNATVGGTLGVTGAVTASSTLGVTSNATVGGTLGVTGATTLSSTLGVSGALTASTTLAVTSNATVGGTLGITGATTAAAVSMSGALTHTGSTVGFFSTSPTTQPTALTAQHATLTQAGTDTGDVAIQAAVDSGGGSAFGFANAAEFEAVVACVLNLMVRVQELEDKLQALGLLA